MESNGSIMSSQQNGNTPLAPTGYKPVVSSSGKKALSRSELSSIVFANYKLEMNDVQTVTGSTLGSTFPLVKLPRDEESCDYNPFEHRKVSHPTNDSETLIHLLKGSLGSGILAMPLAFANGGLWFGLAATFLVGIVCTYCVHILVKCSHILCRRTQVPSLAFADVAETAFLAGPAALHKWSRLARFIVNAFLVIDLLGCCCVYNVFVAKNLKQVVEHYSAHNPIDLRIYIFFLLGPLILINLIRNLKHLAPFSIIANILMGTGVAITMYYIFVDLPSASSRPAIADLHKLPMFFGTVIFALEGIGVVMSLENNMKSPSHFLGCPGVLNLGMAFVVTLYAVVGFLGYLKYGETTAGSITLNLPLNEIPAQLVKLSIALAIFLTYALQFYVPMEIIWKSVRGKFSESNKNIAEYGIRIALVMLTVAISIAIPTIGPFISLIGAVCLSTLGLIFPSLIEIITFYERPGFGRFNWVLIKNILLICFGIVGFFTGTYVSIQEIIDEHNK